MNDDTPQYGPVALLMKLIEDRIAKIINGLVHAHNSTTISGQEALSGIATIAGLRALASDLTTRLKQPK